MAIQMDDSDSITVSEQSEPSAECWQNMYKLLNFYSLISDPTGILEKSSPENCLSGGNRLPAASQPLISTLHPNHQFSCPLSSFTFWIIPLHVLLFKLFYAFLISLLPFLHFHLLLLFCFTNLSITSCFISLFCFVCTFSSPSYYSIFLFSVGIISYLYHKTDVHVDNLFMS